MNFWARRLSWVVVAAGREWAKKRKRKWKQEAMNDFVVVCEGTLYFPPLHRNIQCSGIPSSLTFLILCSNAVFRRRRFALLLQGERRRWMWKRRFAPLNGTISSQVVFTDKVGVFTTQRLLKTSLSWLTESINYPHSKSWQWNFYFI